MISLTRPSPARMNSPVSSPTLSGSSMPNETAIRWPTSESLLSRWRSRARRGAVLLALFGPGLSASVGLLAILIGGVVLQSAFGPAEDLLNMLGDRPQACN